MIYQLLKSLLKACKRDKYSLLIFLIAISIKILSDIEKEVLSRSEQNSKIQSQSAISSTLERACFVFIFLISSAILRHIIQRFYPGHHHNAKINSKTCIEENYQDKIICTELEKNSSIDPCEKTRFVWLIKLKNSIIELVIYSIALLVIICAIESLLCCIVINHSNKHHIINNPTHEKDVIANESIHNEINVKRNLGVYKYTLLNRIGYTASNFSSIAISRSMKTAFITDRSIGSGLIIYNITNIYEPQKIASYNLNAVNYASIKLSLDENALYIQDESTNAGLILLNVSNLKNPTLISTLIPNANKNAAIQSVSDNFTFFVSLVTSIPNINIHDLSNPSSTAVFTTSVSALSSFAAKSIYMNQNMSRIVFTSKNLGIGLQLFNSSWKLQGSYSLNSNYYSSVAFSSDGLYLFVTDSGFGKGLSILNISDPTNITLVSNYQTNAGNYQQIKLSPDEKVAFIIDNFCDASYSPCQGNGMVVLNVSNKLNPTVISIFNSYYKYFVENLK